MPLDALRERWRAAEGSGFDVLWNCDTLVEPDRARHMIFDGPATLTMMAGDTGRLRVGTLVTSLYFRQPVTFAKAAVTVDHLSGGRVELSRSVLPLCPPVTIAAHGPRMLRIAAQHADAWNSWGGYGVASEEAFYAVTAERSHRFYDLCVASDRDPASIRHSLVCFPPLTPWRSTEYFEDMVGRFREIGIDEFVLYWPPTWEVAPREEAVFEEVISAVIPRLRASAANP